MRKELIMKNKFGLVFAENCEPTEKDIQEFADYCMMFYGENTAHSLGNVEGFTMGTCMIAINEYLTGNYPCVEENFVEDENGNKLPTHLWGGGDTIDREKILGIFEKQTEELA